MKKLLIGLCAASLLAASVIGYAGSVTFVNKYNQPVKFTMSQGPVYNPVFEGTLLPGQRTTVYTQGPVTANHYFMAYAPYGSNVVSNCGSPVWPIDNVVVKAGWSTYTGMFTCRIYQVNKAMMHKDKSKSCHKHHHHKHHMKVSDDSKAQG